MPATQISFSDFALAAQQAPIPCTPSVTDAAIAVVAHPLAVGGGECPRLSVRYVVDVHWPGLPVRSFRWRTAKEAKRCARDFPNSRAAIRPVTGYMTFSGFVEVSAP